MRSKRSIKHYIIASHFTPSLAGQEYTNIYPLYPLHQRYINDTYTPTYTHTYIYIHTYYLFNSLFNIYLESIFHIYILQIYLSYLPFMSIFHIYRSYLSCIYICHIVIILYLSFILNAHIYIYHIYYTYYMYIHHLISPSRPSKLPGSGPRWKPVGAQGRTEELGEVSGARLCQGVGLGTCPLSISNVRNVRNVRPGSESVGISDERGGQLKPPGTTKKESTIPKWPASVGPEHTRAALGRPWSTIDPLPAEEQPIQPHKIGHFCGVNLLWHGRKVPGTGGFRNVW